MIRWKSAISVAVAIYSTAFGQCPDTPKEWERLRDARVISFADPFFVGAKNSFDSLVAACETKQSNFFSNPDFQACMKPLNDYRRFQNAFDGGAGLENKSTDDYYKLSRLDYPQVVDAPKEFKSLLPGTLNQIVQQLVQIRKAYPGMQVIQKGNTSFFALIPGDKYDRWVNLTATEESINFLYVGIQKKDSKGGNLEHPKSFFGSYEQFGKGNISLAGRGPSTCIACHRTGAMPVLEHSQFQDHPLVSVFKGEKAEAIAKVLIDRVSDTADAVPDSVSLKGLGPYLGEDIERTPKFIDRPGISVPTTMLGINLQA
jgi:hypothetical protein